MPTDGLSQIETRRTLRLKAGPQDRPRLLFHGPAVTRRAQLQLRFYAVFQASYGDARHGFMIALQSHGAIRFRPCELLLSSQDPDESANRQYQYQTNFKAAFEKQLGLTIDLGKTRKRPVPFIVVDRVEMPTPN